MSIDRQKLVAHLEGKTEELRLKIEGFDDSKGIDSGMVLMWLAKKIVLTHLLDDLYKGEFDKEKPLSEP
ncbi:hypothetical protein [Paenibacillus sinopodophylli]|uniref:hypothetical protein n=1 Tax=Paenibacillus sinopodophylli TaxID=1837342 RepID=UPI00110CC587|nr:hypothetical protein [Paenibacillus sinopodophylli]